MLRNKSWFSFIGGSVLLCSAACQADRDDQMADPMGGDTTGDATGDDGGDDGGSGGDGGDDGGEGTKLDVGHDDEGGGSLCSVRPGDEDAGGTCDDVAPPGSFEPEIQWEWIPSGGEAQATVTPLVANLTDDNGDGKIDLCDTPDVIVIAYRYLLGKGSDGEGWIYVLDGETGAEHFRIDRPVWQFGNPAVGDIDGDGIAEIIAGDHATRQLIAFEHDGTQKWLGAEWESFIGGALGMADLDNDGDVEIYAGDIVTDHEGNELFDYGTLGTRIPTAADLDDDGDLEVITARGAFDHDGTQRWAHPEIGSGFAQIADVDADGRPEIIATHSGGLTILEHDGTIKLADQTPGGNGDPVAEDWARPAAIHDFDGDGDAELSMSTRGDYVVLEFGPLSRKWTMPVADNSGVAGGTAFDFLGDGVAEAMYADETKLFVFDGATGSKNLEWPRSSRTGTEYPVVADVDNDGSAEIVVVSNEGFDLLPNGSYPTVYVIRDAEDRWIQSRRIWNQHAYHVTNVREDGTIPQHERPNWETFNTFRTNAQILPGGGACIPPEG